jgi:hypothetical protein
LLPFSIRTFLASCCLLIGTLLTACHFTASRINREKDKKAAEELVGIFFENEQQNRPEANLQLFSKQFYKATSPQKLSQIFTKRNQLLGKLQRIELAAWETKVVSGTDPSSQYVLQYKNKYEKGDATETFSLLRDENDAIRINGYRLNSDAFLR